MLAAEARAVVRFPYTAANEDELTFAEGDIITVLEQNIVDAGWWKGELKGRVGVFPDNFVELLPADDVSQHWPIMSCYALSATGHICSVSQVMTLCHFGNHYRCHHHYHQEQCV